VPEPQKEKDENPSSAASPEQTTAPAEEQTPSASPGDIEAVLGEQPPVAAEVEPSTQPPPQQREPSPADATEVAPEQTGPSAADSSATDSSAADSSAIAREQTQTSPADAPESASASTDDSADTAFAEQIAPLPDLSNLVADAAASSIELLSDVDLDVKIELGRTELSIEQILRLTEGSVVELDKLAGDPVDILVNEQLIARGEVLVVNDNFCVRINEIVPGVSESIPKAG